MSKLILTIRVRVLKQLEHVRSFEQPEHVRSFEQLEQSACKVRRALGREEAHRNSSAPQ